MWLYSGTDHEFDPHDRRPMPRSIQRRRQGSRQVAVSLVVAALLIVCPASTWQNPLQTTVTPPWLEEDVMRAAMAINMDDTQRSQFALPCARSWRAIRRPWTRPSSAATWQIRPRSSGASEVRWPNRWTDPRPSFLTEAQLPRYTDYRNLLMSKLADDVDRYMGIASDDDVHIGPTATH